MSKIGDLVSGALTSVLGNAAGQAFSALFMTGRSIGGIIPDVTVEETHTDRLTTTKHPVEQGAAVTDHAYKEAAAVTMRIGWSDSKNLTRSIVSGSLFSGSISSANDLYKAMLDLQASRKRFDLVTGKRTYKYMLITQIRQTTNQDTENSVVLDIDLEQQIVVQTTSVSLLSTADQANPSATGPVQNTGTKQAVKAVQQSALFTLFGGG
jgi:hypothetical protein